MYKKHTSKVKKTSKEYVFIHLARILGSIAVVGIHSVGLNSYIPLSHYPLEWWTQTVGFSISLWAVPLFIMISGALLLSNEKTQNIKEFYTKRFLRVGIPAFVWIPFYFLFFHFLLGAPLTWHIIIYSIMFASFYHLYFLILILELYLIAPLLYALVKNLSNRYLLFASLLFFFIGAFWNRGDLTVGMFVPYIGYFILGYYLLKLEKNKKYVRYSLATFIIVCIAITVLNYYFTVVRPDAHIINAFVDFGPRPLVILLTTSLFVYLKNSDITDKVSEIIPLQKIKYLASYTLGIYILHPLIQQGTVKYLHSIVPFSYLPWYGLLLFIPYTLAFSYILVFLLKKIKYVSKTI